MRHNAIVFGFGSFGVILYLSDLGVCVLYQLGNLFVCILDKFIRFFNSVKRVLLNLLLIGREIDKRLLYRNIAYRLLKEPLHVGPRRHLLFDQTCQEILLPLFVGPFLNAHHLHNGILHLRIHVILLCILHFIHDIDCV